LTQIIHNLFIFSPTTPDMSHLKTKSERSVNYNRPSQPWQGLATAITTKPPT